MRQSGANALSVSQAVRAALPEIRASLPSDVALEPFFDSTVYIAESVDEVFVTLGDAVGLVVMVVVLFMGTWRAAGVSMVTIPLSLGGKLAVLLVRGYRLTHFR